ncbi:unnamed protein product [Durusdinium trenchii]|uniref:dCMP deaminase n=2 Tax=Durusdinium trenchii TaxID=1381693 RepID=A0ABP0SSU7_9DINO
MERDSSGPRKGALSWDDYFMGLAFLTAMRSKDPSTQVGACIVNGRNRIVGVGYNGMPSNCSNDELPWGKKSHEGLLSTKYPYVVHAELNAVLNKNAESAAGCRIYTTLFPCNECAKVIIQAGIQQVIYASDKHSDRMSARASRRLFDLAGVEMRQFVPEKDLLALPLRYVEDQQSAPRTSPLAPVAPVSCCGGHLGSGTGRDVSESGLGKQGWMALTGFAFLGAGVRFRARAPSWAHLARLLPRMSRLL